MRISIILTSTLLILLFISLSACSSSKSPVDVNIKDSSNSTLPDSSENPDKNRDILAVYNAVIDPAAKTFTIEPIKRDVSFHFPLTQLYPNVLKITGYGWTPNFWADIRIKHPLPGSGIDAFDPRVIAILPANPGVRFIYPVLGVGGNNSVVLEPDGYTKLFDELGGSIPGNVNPFKAYFKDQPNRIWSSTGVTEETQRWQMKLTGFGGPMQYKLVVDVSTNYPNPPQPIIDNAPEPVEIDAVIGQGMTNQGGSAPIEVRLKHWKDITDVGGMVIESPDLFSNTLPIQYYSYSPYYAASVFKGKLKNEKHAQKGMYKLMIESWDTASGIQMYNEFNSEVKYLTDSGNLIWARRDGGSSYFMGTSRGYACTTLSDNSTVVTGSFSRTAVFGQNDPNETQLVSVGPDYTSDILIARYNTDGTLEWAKRAGGTSSEYGWAITTLLDNSVVVAGQFYDTAEFGTGELNQTLLTSAGNGEIFVARYNPDGTLKWAKRAGGSTNDYPGGITSLSDNSTVVAGGFSGSATFGPGEANETILTSTSGFDIFIARYNPNGTLAWAKHAGGGNDYERCNAITSLSDDSTVVAGYFYGGVIFGEGEPNETILISSGIYDIFIARYNPNGTLAWAKHAGGLSWDEGYGITTLSDNSTVVTGWFSGTTTFGAGEPSETVLTSTGNDDIFIARYNPDGSLAWAKRAGGYEDCISGGDRITTLSDNSTVVTGIFYDTVTFGMGESNETTLIDESGNGDIFIARYNSVGSLLWAKRAGGADYNRCSGVTSLSDNRTVMTGYIYGSCIFGPGELNETELVSVAYYDFFIAQFTP